MVRAKRDRKRGGSDHANSFEHRAYTASQRVSILTPGLTIGVLGCLVAILLYPWPGLESAGPDLPEHARARLEMPGGLVRNLAFAPDGRTLVATCGFEMVVVGRWNVETGEYLEVPGIEPMLVTFAPAISPESQMLATIVERQSIAIWDLRSGTTCGRLDVEFALIGSPAFSPNGELLAAADESGMMHLWETRTGNELFRWSIDQAWVSQIAFSPDGRKLSTANQDGSIARWELATGHRVAVLRGHEGSAVIVDHASDGKTLATSGTDGVIRLWDASTNIERLRIGWRGTPPVLDLAFSPDGHTLATGHADHVVRLWDTATGRLQEALIGHEQGVRALAFSPDGQTLATGDADSVIMLWDLDEF